MRSCNPLTSAPAPRESAVNSLRHPAAPVGEPSRIRRHHLTSTPVARGGLLHRSALSALFFWTVHGPFSFRARPKRKWGVHCPAGNPAVSPGRLITAPTLPQGSGGNPAGGHTGPPLPFPADQLIQRQVVEVRQGNERRQGRFPQTQLIVLIGAPTDPNFRRKSLLAQVPCGSQLKKMFRKCHGHPLFS